MGGSLPLSWDGLLWLSAAAPMRTTQNARKKKRKTSGLIQTRQHTTHTRPARNNTHVNMEIETNSTVVRAFMPQMKGRPIGTILAHRLCAPYVAKRKHGGMPCTLPCRKATGKSARIPAGPGHRQDARRSSVGGSGRHVARLYKVRTAPSRAASSVRGWSGAVTPRIF